MSAPSTSPRPCPCGEVLSRLFFLGWRCDTCAPREAAVRANAIAARVRREARERHLQRQAMFLGKPSDRAAR